jgi:hypothetical protein
MRSAPPPGHRPSALLELGEGTVRYYEDRLTGSIYSSDELGQMLVRREFTTEQPARRFAALPYSTGVLLDEAESIAAEVARDERRPFRS